MLVFLQIANEVIGEMNLNPEEVFLAQGTLRPDLIESASLIASVKAEVIKTHHNDTELIRKLREEVLFVGLLVLKTFPAACRTGNMPSIFVYIFRNVFNRLQTAI